MKPIGLFLASVLVTGCNSYSLQITVPRIAANQWSLVSISVGDSSNKTACIRLTTQTGKLSCRGAYCSPLAPDYNGSESREIYIAVPKISNSVAVAAYKASGANDVIIADVFESHECRPPVAEVAATIGAGLPQDLGPDLSGQRVAAAPVANKNGKPLPARVSAGQPAAVEPVPVTKRDVKLETDRVSSGLPAPTSAVDGKRQKEATSLREPVDATLPPATTGTPPDAPVR